MCYHTYSADDAVGGLRDNAADQTCTLRLRAGSDVTPLLLANVMLSFFFFFLSLLSFPSLGKFQGLLLSRFASALLLEFPKAHHTTPHR